MTSTPSMNLETVIKGSSGTLALSYRTSKNGKPYYAMIWSKDGGHRGPMVPIFGAEMTWSLNALKALVASVDVAQSFEQGTYPLVSRITSSGGLAWDAECDAEGAVTFVFRRFNKSIFRNQQDFFTRYFVPAKMGRAAQQVSIPRDFFSDGSFAEFVAEIETHRARIRDALAGTLSPATEREFDPFLETVLAGKLTDYTATSLSNAILLERPVPRVCLDLCDEERTARELSEFLPLNSKEIGHILDWTQRYAPSVVADAFIFSPRSETVGDKFLAVRQRDLFRCDPLLTCLDPKAAPEHSDDEDSEWLSAPQCNAKSFQKAFDSGLASGFVNTAFGRAPVPEELEAAKARSFVRMHTSMRKHRYKILQLAWRASAEIQNLAGGVSQDPVLCFQQAALLRHDAAIFFPGEHLDLQEAIRGRMQSVLAGHPGPTSNSEWDDLPQKRTE